MLIITKTFYMIFQKISNCVYQNTLYRVCISKSNVCSFLFVERNTDICSCDFWCDSNDV